MQIHYACLRNVNGKMYRRLGPDTGYDMIANAPCGSSIAAFLSALDETDECPKTILYSLNPTDFDQISTVIGCFQSKELPGKIQHGAAWWFNDTKSGMEAQMRSLANLGLLGNFLGMPSQILSRFSPVQGAFVPPRRELRREIGRASCRERV